MSDDTKSDLSAESPETGESNAPPTPHLDHTAYNEDQIRVPLGSD